MREGKLNLNRQIFEFDDKNKNKENKDSDLIDKVQKQDKFSPNTNSLLSYSSIS